ncbi:MAG: HEAT repeat domain-containing protein [Planctomycetota bacterium]
MTALVPLLLLLAPDTVGELKSTLKRYEKEPYEQYRREKAIRSLGAIGSEASTRVLEGVLEDPYAHIRDEAVSALIRLKRKSRGERGVSIQLLGGYLKRRSRAETRRHVATALGLIGDRIAVPFLVDALRKEKDPHALEAIARALSRLGPDDRAFEALTGKAARSAPGRAACLDALGWLPNSAEAVKVYAGDPDDAVRAAVVDALVRRKRPVLPDLEVDDRVGERLGIALADSLGSTGDRALARSRAARLLRHPSWRVRAATLAAVEALRDATLLPDVVDLLARERGRLRHDAWSLLRRLTGKEIPPDPEQWRAILPIADLPPPNRAPEKTAKTRAYFGMPVVSENVAFVFDVSGSMRDDGKIEMARERFRRTALELGPEQRYDLFVLRYHLEYPPRPRLERAFGALAAGRAKRAAAWLDRQEAKGAGAIFDGLRAAIADDEVDTIYLLSDGVPSFGTVKRDYRVLQEVRRLNRWRRVVIHTILLGEKGTDRKFMKALAALTGGRAVDGKGCPLG